MPVVNEAISDSFVLRDNANVAITGKVEADFSVVESYALPSGSPGADVILTEIGAGEYAVTFTPTTVATWVCHVIYDAGGVFREFSQTYVVVATDAAPVITPTPVVGGTTLLDLVRRLGYRLGDLIVATGTQAGTTSQFYDEIRLRCADNAYRSWDAYVVSAAVPGNVGQSRFVQGSTQSGGVITVQPPLTAGNFAVGDVVELHGSAGVGWTRTEKIAAINEAISQAATMGGIEAVASAAALFDRDNPIVTVPANLRFVHHVEWLDTDGLGHTIPYAKNRNLPGWWANEATGTVEILGGYRESANGKTIRFWGHGDHVPLEADTDATLVNPTWIIAAAVYYLSLGYGQDRDPEKMRSLIADSRQEMQVWRRAATRVRPPGSVALRGY